MTGGRRTPDGRRRLLGPFAIAAAALAFAGPAEAQEDAAAAVAEPPPPPSTAPGGRSAAARLEPDGVRLGETVSYVLTIRRAPTDRVQLWPVGKNPFGPLRPRGIPAPSEKQEGLVVAVTFRIELVALEPGRAEIPPVAVSLVAQDGRVYEIAPEAQRVEVTDPTANEPLADVRTKGEKGADGRTTPVVPYVIYVRDWTAAIVAAVVGGVLLVALVAVLLTRWLVRRRMRPGAAEAPEPPAYPSVRARLARLREPGAYAAIGAKAFHVEIVEAVKEYIGRRHRIDALEMTSEELLDATDGVSMGSVTRLEMEMFLSSCDIVKFAGGEPPEKEALDALAQAERIVETVELAVTADEVRRAAREAMAAAAAAGSPVPIAPPPLAGPPPQAGTPPQAGPPPGGACGGGS